MKKLLMTLLSAFMCLTIIATPIAAEKNEYKTWVDAVNEPDWYPFKYTVKNISKAFKGLAEVPDNIKNQRKANKQYIENIKKGLESAKEMRKDAFSTWYNGDSTPKQLVTDIGESYIAETAIVGLNGWAMVSWSLSLFDAVMKLID